MKPVQVIAVTGGKGGVGKSTASVNLAVTLAQEKQVMLLDADLGLANVDIMLGLRARKNISHVLSGECQLRDIVIKGPVGLRIVPASSGTQAMAELTPTEHSGFIRAFSDLADDLDFLIIDTAAGVSDSVVSFTRAASQVIIVVCDEPTSLTDAYALMKILNREYKVASFNVIANMTHDHKEGRSIFAKLTKVTEQFLDVSLNYLGEIPFDKSVRQAVREHKPLCLAYPVCTATTAINKLAKKVLALPEPTQSSGGLAFFFERLLHAQIEHD